MSEPHPNPETEATTQTRPTVAMFSGTCVFCRKPTKAGRDLHFYRMTRHGPPDAPAVYRQACYAHGLCHAQPAPGLIHR